MFNDVKQSLTGYTHTQQWENCEYYEISY